ncbi:phage repressor protein CI [Klebsiella aerogenes]|nr:phage repressor protein CI [Klebsiella aerogenes]HEJ0189287.1 phage repressor protein CI [Klebsiella aerogenes]
MNLEKGGRGAIERMVEAYGFKTRQALCDHLGISKSTLATRYMRDSFPAEWIIQCALETGTSLSWLTNGYGIKEGSQNENIKELPLKILYDGELCPEGSYVFDINFLPKALKNPMVVVVDSSKYICDIDYDDVRDGKWIVNIDGEISMRTITRLPGWHLHVEGGISPFECALEDIIMIAKIVMACLEYK